MKTFAWLILTAGTGALAVGATTSASAAPAALSTPGQSMTSGSTAKTGANPAQIARPSDPADVNGWAAYLRLITQQNSQGLTQADSYLYFLPLESAGVRERQIDDFRELAHRQLRPGNLIAFAGPDSAVAADLLVEAFHGESANWAAGAILLFIGAPADKGRVFDAWKTSGATLRFVDMQGVNSIQPTASAAPLPHFIGPPPLPPPAPPAPAVTSGCPEKTSEACASLFAHGMTDIIKNVSTGRGPFQLVAVTSAGRQVTMTYKGSFTDAQLSGVLASKGQTKEGFLNFTHDDFTRYQCGGPVRDLLTRGVQIRNVLTFQDGSPLDAFDITQCP